MSWVLFKSTYTGPQGFFPAGAKRDLPDNTLALISDDFYTKCKAPWNEHVDEKAATKRGKEACIFSAKQKFLALQSDVDAQEIVTEKTAEAAEKAIEDYTAIEKKKNVKKIIKLAKARSAELLSCQLDIEAAKLELVKAHCKFAKEDYEALAGKPKKQAEPTGEGTEAGKNNPNAKGQDDTAIEGSDDNQVVIDCDDCDKCEHLSITQGGYPSNCLKPAGSKCLFYNQALESLKTENLTDEEKELHLANFPVIVNETKTPEIVEDGDATNSQDKQFGCC